ncbi:hypothetical protein, partial [Pseudochrobactrum kiredjianiae]|uniref:hypothetical protein n=1 Tax=Pseudochrobactrum kiredjianiae TaxID=386305 RepID=UPI0035BC776B
AGDPAYSDRIFIAQVGKMRNLKKMQIFLFRRLLPVQKPDLKPCFTFEMRCLEQRKFCKAVW